MQKFENFFIEDKNHKIPVVNSIKLIEKQPEETLLNSLSQKEVRNEKGVFVKRIIGVLFFIVAIIQFIGIFINLFRGYYEGLYDFKWWIHLFVLLFFTGIGAGLFRRKKAVTPISAFQKYWESYFQTPDASPFFKTSPNIVGLFFPLANVNNNLKSFYPVNIELDEEKIVQFVACMAENIEKHYVDLSQENENLELVYGVTIKEKKENYSISEINETLLSVDGCINIFKCYKGKHVTGYCIKLNICTYFVKLGKYWAPVNPIPQFTFFEK